MSTQDASTPGQPSDRRSSIAVEDVAHTPDVGNAITSDAAKATASETSMTLLEGLKTYPKAVGWSILLSTCIILCGLPWGTFQTLTTTYASEVCPVALRPYLTTYVNLCWVIGQFLSSAVLKGVSEETGPLGYKIPYGLQWIWPVPLIIGIALAPESPWWLVRKGRNEDAKKQLLRLTSRSQVDFDPDATISVNLRRTEIVTFVWAIQTLCGASSMIGFSTYFFTQAGLDTSHAFSMSLGLYALGAVGTLGSWFLMGWFGRRTLYLWGQILMSLVLIVTGFMGIANSSGAQWAIAAMMLLFTFIYDATVGPVCYSLVAELASTRLRNKTAVLARNLYNITGIIANILTPHMLNPDSSNWGAKAGFFWGGACALCAVWTFFRLPEPKARTYAELDVLFQAKVSARRFASTDVSALSGSQSGHGNDEKSLHDAEHYEVKLGSEKTAYIQST
ncbi:sugar porter family MFS transporter [Hortaea werneckii]|nr:sugar porter family MFS transporter [Hortaea werneckii]